MTAPLEAGRISRYGQELLSSVMASGTQLGKHTLCAVCCCFKEGGSKWGPRSRPFSMWPFPTQWVKYYGRRVEVRVTTVLRYGAATSCAPAMASYPESFNRTVDSVGMKYQFCAHSGGNPRHLPIDVFPQMWLVKSCRVCMGPK